jgi:hypothetical protein
MPSINFRNASAAGGGNLHSIIQAFHFMYVAPVVPTVTPTTTPAATSTPTATPIANSLYLPVVLRGDG